LIIRKHLSQTVSEYRNKVFQAIAADQLTKEEVTINAGESIDYIITNSLSRIQNKRVLAFELCESNLAYDSEAYIDLLRSAAEVMFMPLLEKRNSTAHIAQTHLSDSRM
jgi:DNA polymerase elongation subunit (family B)